MPICEAHQLLPERSVTGYGKAWPVDAATVRPAMNTGQFFCSVSRPIPTTRRSLTEVKGSSQVRLAFMVGRKKRRRGW